MGAYPDWREPARAAAWKEQTASHVSHERRPITMRGIIALVIAAVGVIAAVTVLSFASHFLFSPWLLAVAAVAVLAWFKVRRRRFRR
jgi:hypothetical protein